MSKDEGLKMDTINIEDNRNDIKRNPSLHLPQSIIKGMINPNHTSCYINSAICLLCYTIQPLVIQFIQEYVSYAGRTSARADTTSITSPLLNASEQEFIHLLCDMMYNNSGSDIHNNRKVIDPSRFYALLLSSSSSSSSVSLFRHKIHPTSEGGDAVSTFIYLVQLLVTTSNKLYDDNKNDNVNNNGDKDRKCHHDGNDDDTTTAEHQSLPTYTPESIRVQDTCNALLYSSSMYTSITEYIATTTITTTARMIPIGNSDNASVTASGTASCTKTMHDSTRRVPFNEDTKKETSTTYIKYRTKQLKKRSMWNPLPVPITKSSPINEFNDTNKNIIDDDENDVVAHLQRATLSISNENYPKSLCPTSIVVSSLQEALHNLLCTERLIHGNYHWPSPIETNTTDSNASITSFRNDSNDVVQDRDESKSTTEKVYYKKYHVQHFPPILAIHLERFAIPATLPQSSHDTTIGVTNVPQPIEDIHSQIQIPELLNVEPYIENHSSTKATIEIDNYYDNITNESKNTILERRFKYQLAGGILHIHDYGTESDDNNNNDTTDDNPVIGHYVSVIRQVHNDNIENDIWYLIDDEIVVPVSIEQVLVWLGGDWYKNPDLKHNESIEHRNERLFARGILLIYHNLDMISNGIIATSDEATSVSEAFDKKMFEQQEQIVEERKKRSDAQKLDAKLISSPTTDPLQPQHSRYQTTMKHEPTPKSYWLDDDDDDDSDSV